MVKASLPHPCDSGFGEAVCVTGQHGRVAYVGGGVHLGLSHSDSGNDWGKEDVKINAEYSDDLRIVFPQSCSQSRACSISGQH